MWNRYGTIVPMNSMNMTNDVEKIILDAEYLRTKGYLSLSACQSILENAAELNSESLFGVGYFYFAEYYFAANDFDKAFHCLGECTKRFPLTKQYEYLARTYNMSGNISNRMGNRLAALNYYYTSLQYSDRYEYNYTKARTYSGIADILMQLKKYEEAAKQYEIAISFYSSDDFKQAGHMTDAIIMYGICQALTRHYETVDDMLKKAQEMRLRYPKARFSYLGFITLDAVSKFLNGNAEAAMNILSGDVIKRAPIERYREFSELIIPGLDLLVIAKHEEFSHVLLHNLDIESIKTNPEMYIALFPFISKMYLEAENFAEYEKQTKEYFEAYEKHIKYTMEVTGKILELQDALQSVEREHKNLKAHNKTLRNIAYYDSMTELPNRAYINEYLTDKFEAAKAENKELGVELLDIDHFKGYNDTYGHLMGDECIVKVGTMLREFNNDRVFVARYGGDEFMIIYYDMSYEEIAQTAEHIKERAHSLRNEENGVSITLSQGIYISVPNDDNHEWDFGFEADKCLYMAKDEGRDTYHIEKVI